VLAIRKRPHDGHPFQPLFTPLPGTITELEQNDG
ncbi:unnamed protein product, partial [marine sediment metagenome]